jgi:hypothetical protein
MSHSNEVAPLKVADEAFLVATTIERCPKTMMIRELFMNAIEAAVLSTQREGAVEIRSLVLGGVAKLSIWNTGPGMSSEELYRACDIASSIGKGMGLDQNFGMGAKVASLPSNRFGLRYRSCKDGVVSEVILGERGGVYGRLRRQNSDGQLEEVFDVTETVRANGVDTSRDWTEVVLFGNQADQNTVRDPYNGDPSVSGQWLADYLYYRFFRLPDGVTVKFLPGTHKLDGSRFFRTIPERAFPTGQSEGVETQSGIKIHYFYDPPLAGTSHNKSVSGAITSDVSTCAVVHKNEMYDLKRSRQWTLDAPLYGVPFGAKHISVHVELPDDFPVLPEGYREFLRYRDGDQRRVEVRDFSDLVRQHRPAWLIDRINSHAPSDSGGTDEIRDELQKLLNSLRVKSPGPTVDNSGRVQVDYGQGNGSTPTSTGGNAAGQATVPHKEPDDLLAVPTGAKRASMSLNSDRAPEITPLHDEADVEEKGFKGKAAKFYRDPGVLFINMRYPAVEQMQRQLETEYAASPDPEFMRRMAKELAERTIISRVGRAVVFALAKQLNREWSPEDMARAQSPESLSLAADDFADALQNARRRMGQALRTGKDDQAAEQVA